MTTTHPVHRGPKGSGSSAGVLEDHRPGQQATAQPNLSSAHSPGCGSHQTCSGHWWGCTAFLHTPPPLPHRHHREKKKPSAWRPLCPQTWKGSRNSSAIDILRNNQAANTSTFPMGPVSSPFSAVLYLRGLGEQMHATETYITGTGSTSGENAAP